MQWQLPSVSSVFPPNPAQTMRGRLETGLWSSLQDCQVAVRFAECSSWSCLSWSDHRPSMISSLLFQSSYSAPTNLLLLPLLPCYLSATCSISLFPWNSRESHFSFWLSPPEISFHPVQTLPQSHLLPKPSSLSVCQVNVYNRASPVIPLLLPVCHTLPVQRLGINPLEKKNL